MSLFGGLYVGKSGLQSSQNALNTVAHNLSNINTPGYVRQQVAQSDLNYSTISMSQAIAFTRIGQGVQYSECRHIRDDFLDKMYRSESGRSDFYETSYSAVLEVEDILGELDGAAFKESVEGLWTAMEELSKSPNDSTYITLFVSKCAIFAENATAVYKSLNEYQNNLNLQIKNMVDEMNQIGERIVWLNDEIAKIEVGGVEHANDLRDERDLLIDTLSGFGNVSYDEDIYGRVSIRFNETDFVTDYNYYKIGLDEDLETGFYTPYWEQNVIWTTNDKGEKKPNYSSAYLFDPAEVVSTDRNTDIGALRALLLARGDHVANYTDMETSQCTDIKEKNLNITENQFNEDYGLKYYNDYIANSIMMNVQAEFDNLVHGIVTKINDVLAQACDPASGYLCNDDGTPMQMFIKTIDEPYEKITTQQEVQQAIAEGAKLYQIYDKDGKAIENHYWKYKEEDPNSTQTLYNCANLQINQELVQTPTKLGFKKEDDSADYNLGEAFIKAFEDATIKLNPLATKDSSYQNCYTEIVNQIGLMGSVFKGKYEYQQLSVQQIESNRQSVIGVSSDEELEHMIMYQNSYNAASRYINVLNTLMDSVLSMAQ